MSVVIPPHIESRDSVRTAGITRSVTMDQIGSLGESIGVVAGWLAERGAAPVGPPFFRYHVIDMQGESRVEAGFPVAADAELGPDDGDVALGSIPAGRYAVVVHRCHPDELAQATGDLLAWAKTEGLAWDAWDAPEGHAWRSRLESYFTDPDEQPDMSQWETELAFRLAD
jgi:effector-binding domain-containing protein